MNIFYKESKLKEQQQTNKNKKKKLAVGRGWGLARVSIFDFFFQKNPSLEKKIVFFLRG